MLISLIIVLSLVVFLYLSKKHKKKIEPNAQQLLLQNIINHANTGNVSSEDFLNAVKLFNPRSSSAENSDIRNFIDQYIDKFDEEITSLRNQKLKKKKDLLILADEIVSFYESCKFKFAKSPEKFNASKRSIIDDIRRSTADADVELTIRSIRKLSSFVDITEGKYSGRVLSQKNYLCSIEKMQKFENAVTAYKNDDELLKLRIKERKKVEKILQFRGIV